MNLSEMKKKTLSLIEEVNPDSEYLTDDVDLAAKFNHVANQVQYELSRMKKIPKYAELTVAAGDTLTFAQISTAVGREVYQLGTVCGVAFVPKAGGTVLKIRSAGVAEIECFVYPERISDETDDRYEFELSDDVLEIMPYGIAADLLKSDVSAEYGSVYATRYETMLQRLDPRYALTSITFEGGVDI